MSFHTLFGKHVPDLQFSRWDSGQFVTSCTSCGCQMIKLPGLSWQVLK